MKLTVFRGTPTANSTPGTLEINGVFECFSLEKVPTFEGRRNVQDKTCIPAGTYPLELKFSQRHQCIKPWVMNVPGRSDIEIDVANTADELLGCTAVGETRMPDFVGHSQIAFNALMARLKSAGAEPLTITYVDFMPVLDPELGL